MDERKTNVSRFADSGWHRIVSGMGISALGAWQTIQGPRLQGTYPPIVDWLLIFVGVPLVIVGILEILRFKPPAPPPNELPE